MKKVAIVLTGQVRSWTACKYFIYKIKKKYDVDIFLSIDKNNSIQNEYENSKLETQDNEIKEILDYYNPKMYYINDTYNFDEIGKLKVYKNIYKQINDSNENIKNSIYSMHDNKIIIKSLYYNSDCYKYLKNESLYHYKKIFEQYFYVYKGYELLENYINDNKVDYDMILRLRFDQFIWNNNDIEKYNLDKMNNDKNKILYNITNINKIKNSDIEIELDECESNIIYVFGGGCYKNYAYLNDQFWCHNQELILKLKEFYLKLPYIINNCKDTFYPDFGCWIEHFFCKYIVENNIDIKKSCLDGVFIRKNFN